MLVEVMIALVIFSVGILGVVGIQATTISNSTEAQRRTDASFLANQILAQMWVDPLVTTNPDNLAVNPTYACNPCTTTNGNANTRSWVSQIQSSSSSIPSLPDVTDTMNQPSIVINPVTNVVTIELKWGARQNSGVHNYATATEMIFN